MYEGERLRVVDVQPDGVGTLVPDGKPYGCREVEVFGVHMIERCEIVGRKAMPNPLKGMMLTLYPIIKEH